MANLFKLVGSVFIDNEEANKSLSKTEEKAGGVGSKLLDGVKSAGKFAAGLTAAAGAGVTALTKMATNSANTLDVVDKGSQKMGISAESYQEWAHAMSQSGMDISSMQNGMKTLQNQMDGVVQGTDASIEAFDRLGVSVYDQSGNMKDQTTMLNEVMMALAGMEDGAERTALAVDMFGKSGTELLPLLNSGQEGIQALKDEAHELGLVFSDETIASGVVLGDTIANVKDSMGALATGLGASLVPILQQVCDLILDNLPMIQGMFNKLAPILTGLFEALMPQITSLAETLLPILVDMFDMLLPVFGDLCEAILPVISDLVATLLPPLLQIVKSVMPLIVSLLEALMPLLKPLFSILSPILQVIMAILQPLLDLLNFILPPIIEVLTTVAEVVITKISNALSKISTKISNVIDAVVSKAKLLKDKISDIFEKVKDAVKKPINAVIGFINGLVSGVCNGINVMIRALNSLSFDVPDWVPGIGGKTFGFNLSELVPKQIPLLAEGAVIEPNKPFAAVLGDQKNGTNIEAPLDTIKQAVREELTNLALDLNIHLDPETKKWFKEIKAESHLEFKRTGKPQMA